MSAETRRRSLSTLAGGFGLLLSVAVGFALGTALHAQAKREFTVSARKYAFTVEGQATARIVVQQDDLVRITFAAEDIPHSFAIDDYKIAKRAEPGKPVTFEFRADKASASDRPFVFYCNLTIDDGCRKMRGELVVMPKRVP